MNQLTMSGLEKCFDTAIRTDAVFIGVSVNIPGCINDEVIINAHTNFKEKLAYYKTAYDENLIHKFNTAISITGFAYADSYAALQVMLA